MAGSGMPPSIRKEIPPKNFGEEPLYKNPKTEKNGKSPQPGIIVVVVECCCILIKIIVVVRWTRLSKSAAEARRFSKKSCVPPV